MRTQQASLIQKFDQGFGASIIAEITAQETRRGLERCRADNEA